MPLPRIYTLLVAAREPDPATLSGPAAPPAPRAFYASFRIRATSAEIAADYLRTTPDWAALSEAHIEEIDDQGPSWWGWWQREPRLVERMGRAYFGEEEK